MSYENDDDEYNEIYSPEEERMVEEEFVRDAKNPTGVIPNIKSWGDFLMKNPGIILNQPTTVSTTKNTANARDALRRFSKYQKTKQRRHATEAKSPFYPVTVGAEGVYVKLNTDKMNELSHAASFHIDNMPKDSKGQARLFNKTDDLPFVIAAEMPVTDEATGLTTNQMRICADFSADCPEYQQLLKKGTMPNTVMGEDGKPFVNGFKMSMPVACKLLVQSSLAANMASETVDFYAGAHSKGLKSTISANEADSMVDHLNAIAKDEKSALTAFSPSNELFAHGVLPKHMVGRQVNVYTDLKDLCADVGTSLKKYSVGAKATMGMDDVAIEKVKTNIGKEVSAALGSVAHAHGYDSADVKAFKLFVGSGFYGNDSSIFNADANALKSGMIQTESIGYTKHDCPHMMVRAEIGDHVVDVPIVPLSKSSEDHLYKMRVAAAACTSLTDNCNFDHTAMHNINTHTMTSSDGKVLASFY